MKKTNRRDIFKGRALAHMKSEPIALLAALFAGVAGAAMPLTQFRLPLLKNAPVVDGRVDPSEWRNAVGFFGLCAYSTDQAVSVPVEVRVGRTADRLFVAATRTVGPAGLPIVPKNGDADVTSDDNFECLFVNDILLEEPDLRQVIANSVGEISAAYSCDKVRTTWTPSGVETKSTLKDGLWQFEMSVPLKEVGFAEKDAARHGLRVCHTFRNLGTKEGCQASAQPEDVEYFGTDRIMKVAFDDEVPAVTLREGKSDRSNWRTTLELFNGTKREMRLAVRVEGRPADSQPGGVDTEVVLKPGEVRTLPVSGAIIGDEKVDFFASVRKAGDGEPCFFRQLRWRPNAPAPDWVASDADISGPIVDFAYYPSYDRIRVKADVSRMEKRPDEVMLRLESEAGKTLARTEIRTDAAGKAERIWKIPSLKTETEKSGKGGYVLVVTCGTEEIRRPFRRDVFPWEGFRGGRSGTLPPPFTPVRKEGDHVKTILKDHTVGQFGLWNQVNAAGKDILARSMRLVSEPASYAAELEASSSWDVDGMMIWELKLKPGRCRSLWLEIPLKAERAKLMHACTDGLRFNFSGALPSGNGRIWDSSMARRNAIVGNFVPYVWIGGPLRGLSVFGENDKGWVTDDEKARCQEIHREGDGTVRLVLNLIQKPCEVVESRRIRIGFLATPTKPMEDGWRYKNCGELMGSCWWWGGYTDSDELYPYDGTDEFFRKMGETRRAGKYDYDRNYADKAVAERLATVPKNAPEYKTTQEIIKTHYHGALERMAAYGCTPGAKIAFYTNARGLRLGRPEGTTFCDEWTREEFSNRPFAVGDSLSYSLDPNDTYLDFAAYWWERMISTGACDYLYWDDVFCAANFDLVGTDAYVRDDGRIQPATGIFNQRAIVRRGAVLQAERNWESRRNWVHMTNTALAPVCSFAGQIYDWEDFYGDKPLHERYPRELIQAETIGRQFGCRSAVMAYFATKDPESAKLQKLERQGTGLCLTHELEWERWRVKCYAKAMELLETFGYRKPEARVWNYWDEDVPFPAAVTGGKNAALAVVRDGEAVFVVSDFEKGGDYELKPDFGALGAPEIRWAIDLESGRELPMKDGGVRFTLEKYDFIMIKFAKKTQGDS